jgi:hypothetical protein
MESVGAALATYCGQNVAQAKSTGAPGGQSNERYYALYALAGFVIAKFAEQQWRFCLSTHSKGHSCRIGQFLYCNALAYFPWHCLCYRTAGGLAFQKQPCCRNG